MTDRQEGGAAPQVIARGVRVLIFLFLLCISFASGYYWSQVATEPRVVAMRDLGSSHTYHRVLNNIRRGVEIDVVLEGCDTSLDVVMASAWDRRDRLTREEREALLETVRMIARYRAKWPRPISSQPRIAAIQRTVDGVLQEVAEESVAVPKDP